MRTDEKQFEITSTRSLTYWCYLKRYRSLTVSTVQMVRQIRSRYVQKHDDGVSREGFRSHHK